MIDGVRFADHVVLAVSMGARRARLILMLDAGHTWASIREKLDCTDSFIDRWVRDLPLNA